MDFQNSTHLSDDRLLRLFEDGMRGWAVGRIVVRVRYSRGADYSGTCFYADRRVYINLGRHLKYPYRMDSNLAKVKLSGTRWRRPVFSVEMRDAYMVVLFVFMHELYHLLVKKARRNTRQKESMCDRFAARHLVDNFNAIVRDESGRRVDRELWDFQNLDGFVAAARDARYRGAAIRPLQKSASRPKQKGQLWLFGDMDWE
jgi:hypothetical protein